MDGNLHRRLQEVRPNEYHQQQAEKKLFFPKRRYVFPELLGLLLQISTNRLQSYKSVSLYCSLNQFMKKRKFVV
jgi:hypothetical protein